MFQIPVPTKSPNWEVIALKSSVAFAAAASATYIHPLTALLCVAFGVLMIFDIATGLMVAYAQKTVASELSRKGMMKKAAMITVVLANLFLIKSIHYLEAVTGTPIAITLPLLGVVEAHVLGNIIPALYCITETISLIENTYKLDAPWPKFIIHALIKVKSQPNSPFEEAGETDLEELIRRRKEHPDQNAQSKKVPYRTYPNPIRDALTQPDDTAQAHDGASEGHSTGSDSGHDRLPVLGNKSAHDRSTDRVSKLSESHPNPALGNRESMYGE